MQCKIQKIKRLQSLQCENCSMRWTGSLMQHQQWHGFCTELPWWRGSWAERQNSHFTNQSTSQPSPIGHELWLVTERMRSQLQAVKMSFHCRVAGLSLRERVRSPDIQRELGTEPLIFGLKEASWGGSGIWLGRLQGAIFWRFSKHAKLGGDPGVPGTPLHPLGGARKCCWGERHLEFPA